ncbi:hypothetical protein [Streptomyces anulatus]|uniref:hypothetical protein n=1 Tax=Streptomyces anulatus TaxID=1892 RepID=UPI0034444200
MTTGTPSPKATDSSPLALPWFGPTLHELVPGTPPGSTPLILRRQAGRAVTSGRQDPDRRELVRRADRNSHTPVAALVAEMLTPPLPRHHTEERP